MPRPSRPYFRNAPRREVRSRETTGEIRSSYSAWSYGSKCIGAAPISRRPLGCQGGGHRARRMLPPRSMRDPETVVREFCAAWSGRDVDAILAWFTADAVYHNMPIAPVRGHAEIRGVLEIFVPPASKIEFEILAVASRGDVVFTERVDRFTVGGKEIAPGRRRVRDLRRQDRRVAGLLRHGELPATAQLSARRPLLDAGGHRRVLQPGPGAEADQGRETGPGGVPPPTMTATDSG